MKYRTQTGELLWQTKFDPEPTLEAWMVGSARRAAMYNGSVIRTSSPERMVSETSKTTACGLGCFADRENTIDNSETTLSGLCPRLWGRPDIYGSPNNQRLTSFIPFYENFKICGAERGADLPHKEKGTHIFM